VNEVLSASRPGCLQEGARRRGLPGPVACWVNEILPTMVKNQNTRSIGRKLTFISILSKSNQLFMINKFHQHPDFSRADVN
jgi:hypothetical protein